MRKRKIRRCTYCNLAVDMKRPKTYVLIESTYWYITKTYVYHKACWTRKRDRENMRKYKERLHGVWL